MDKKKKTFKVKFMAWLITAFILLALGSPFIVIGIGIGYLIWK